MRPELEGSPNLQRVTVMRLLATIFPATKFLCPGCDAKKGGVACRTRI